MFLNERVCCALAFVLLLVDLFDQFLWRHRWLLLNLATDTERGCDRKMLAMYRNVAFLLVLACMGVTRLMA